MDVASSVPTATQSLADPQETLRKVGGGMGPVAKAPASHVAPASVDTTIGASPPSPTATQTVVDGHATLLSPLSPAGMLTRRHSTPPSVVRSTAAPALPTPTATQVADVAQATEATPVVSVGGSDAVVHVCPPLDVSIATPGPTATQWLSVGQAIAESGGGPDRIAADTHGPFDATCRYNASACAATPARWQVPAAGQEIDTDADEVAERAMDLVVHVALATLVVASSIPPAR